MVPRVAGSNPVCRPILPRYMILRVRIIFLFLSIQLVSFGGTWLPDEIAIEEHLNLSYGENSKQVLDVVTSEKCNRSPVVIFVHGGSWRWGQKDYHRSIGKQLARGGILFVTINYRLYPEAKFPSFPEDVALSVKWARENVKKFGGDCDKIFLMGHSAGAHSVSLVGLDSQYLKKIGGGLDWIQGVIPIACPFNFDPTKEFLYRNLFPGEFDPEKMMPMGIKAENGVPPFFIMHGFFDPIIRHELAFKFAKKINDSGGDAKIKLYKSHGHASLIRRTTSWHLWPKPLLQDIVSFVNSKV